MLLSMGSLSIKNKIKEFIASVGWRLFLWGNSMTAEEYWSQIYEQEKAYRENLDTTSKGKGK